MISLHHIGRLRRRLKRRVRYYLALLHRRKLDQLTFVGITGSAAKTTATDLSAAILGQFGRCQKTHEFNALGDIVRTILKTGRAHRYCIAELAATGPGTLDSPIRIFKPDVAVMTVIGRDHYSAYKSMEAIAAEKEKVVLALPPEGTAVLNIDDPLVRAIGERCTRRVIWFGEGEGADLRLLEARSRWPEPLTLLVAFEDMTYEVRTQLHGVHMVTPVLASLGVSLATGIRLEDAVRVLAEVPPPDGRMQVVAGADGVTFVRDDWKAPAWSLDAPLRFLKDAKADRKVAVVGTISDMTGDNGLKYRKIARKVREYADLAVFVGPHAHRAVRARQNEKDTSIQGFPNIRQAADYLQSELRKGDLVLLKGSHNADHLVRIVFDRTTHIGCWKDQCEKKIFCNRCPRLYAPSGSAAFHRLMDINPGQERFVVVGLGNPVASLRDTGHNAGCRVLDALARDAGSLWKREAEGSVSSMVLGGRTIRLFKPGAAMNSNGDMMGRFLERMGGAPQHCFIVHDDADLFLGDVRFKAEGGDAGHKGMRSVISALGTVAIPRVRIGIRRFNDKSKAQSFVLPKFSSNEEAALSRAVEKASEILKKRLRDLIGEETVKPAKEGTIP